MRIITDPDAAREAFRPWRKANARPAWKPVTRPGEGAVAASRFGGRPALRPGEPWPTCAVCGKPQTLFLQLDLDALPPDAGDFGGGLLQFFYCVKCDDGSVETWEPFSDAHLFRRLQTLQPLVVADVPDGSEMIVPREVRSWEQIVDHPHPEDAETLGVEIEFDDETAPASNRIAWHAGDRAAVLPADDDDDGQQGIYAVLGYAAVGDKLGGWPQWVQSPAWADCPECGTRMRLLMQLDSNDGLDYQFGDGGTGHVVQCPNHPDVLSFAWACF